MASPEIIIQLRVAPNLRVILLLRTEVIVHARVEQRFLYCAGIQTCVNSELLTSDFLSCGGLENKATNCEGKRSGEMKTGQVPFEDQV